MNEQMREAFENFYKTFQATLPKQSKMPSAKAIETAALIKAAKVCEGWASTATAYGFTGDAADYLSIRDEILALITPEGKKALEEFGIKCIEVALQLPEHLRIQHNLRASVKQVMEGV